MIRCQYDSDSQPACEEHATHVFRYLIPADGWVALALCEQHTSPMRARVRPRVIRVEEMAL